MERPVALITGASSGIGAALAGGFAAHGFLPVLEARRAERLAALATQLQEQGHPAHVIALDAALPDAPDTIDRVLAGHGLGPVELLVNNAGFGLAGDFADCDPVALDGMLELNVVALTRLTRHFVAGMRTRGSGRVLNVASVAGFQPGGPGMAAYFASKAYVLSLGRALGRELRGSGVTVTTLCPGPTATEFEDVAGPGGLRLFRWLPVASAQSVADAGVRATLAGRSTCVPGIVNNLLGFAGRFSPVFGSLEVNAFLLRQP